ncbi:hypothetical protein [Streptosporangium vulgare]|uniref:Molecular chaperone n=1 Tax=Streptosporangium vulgare TaxID=46190 RepID=A0ABV5TJM9_9ACTN
MRKRFAAPTSAGVGALMVIKAAPAIAAPTADTIVTFSVTAGTLDIVAPAGRPWNELVSWTSLDRDSVDLPPGGTATAQVTIKVPPIASRGERFGVVWAEVAAEPDDAHPVRVVNRVGIRVYLGIGPGGEPPSDFRIEKLTPVRTPDGSPQLEALVHNTGERTLDMNGPLSPTDGPGGLQAGPFPPISGSRCFPVPSPR